ncbi:MAG: DUF4810 domain-containing protein [Burkholderiales bacterium]
MTLGLGIALLAGCAHRGPPPLYVWESFPKMQYDTLLAGGNSPSEQIAAMNAQAERARAAGATLPPGFRAHLGMLKLAAGDAEEARLLWESEKQAFPESSPYMNQLLKRLNEPAKKDPA